MSQYMWDALTGEIHRVPKYPIGTKLMNPRTRQMCTVIRFSIFKMNEYVLQWESGNRTEWTEEGIDNKLLFVEQKRYTKVELLDEELFEI